jgi:glucose/arabinose dehydrogenase
MMRKSPFLVFLVLVLATLACFSVPRPFASGDGEAVVLSPQPTAIQPAQASSVPQPTSGVADVEPSSQESPPTPLPPTLAPPSETEPTTPVVETVVNNGDFPIALAFTPDGRLFYTEKSGRVRVVVNGELQGLPVISLPTDDFFERGLLGLAVDPNYEQNHYIWVYHTLPEGQESEFAVNRVVRFEERDGVGSDPQVALSVPVVTGAGNHNGGNIHFGPDGMLYVTIGEYAEPPFAQNPDVVPGKIHRFVPTMPLAVPGDNPISGNSIYALGLRNSFDFTFDPFGGALFATENGPSCDDEINLILPGGNYGWGPDYQCDDSGIGPTYPYRAPLLYYTPPEALTGITVYTGSQVPQWQGDLFYCAWNTGILRRAELTPARDGIASVEPVALDGALCQTDVVTGTDGALYFANQDAINRIIGQ